MHWIWYSITEVIISVDAVLSRSKCGVNHHILLWSWFFKELSLTSDCVQYISIYKIYILDWEFLTVSKVCKGRNSSNMLMGSLDQVLSFTRFVLVFESLQCTVSQASASYCCVADCFGFLWTDLHLSSVSLCIIPPKMAALVWASSHNKQFPRLFSSCLEWHLLL